MQINGVELVFKITNASTAGKLEKAVFELDQKMKSQPTEQGLEAVIQYQCRAAGEFIDEIFGAGTYEKLGIDPEDLDENLKAVDDVIEEAAKQKEAFLNRTAKYAPNRAARRAKK